MSLLDIFRKKKKGRKEKGPGKKEIKKLVEEKPLEKEEVKIEVSKQRKKIPGKNYQVLDFPHITEKATDFAEKNKYVFNVYPRTNKIEVKKAVENAYGINVVDVKIINIPRKKRRLGRQTGWKKGYKKAIVKIKEGQKIEILPR